LDDGFQHVHLARDFDILLTTPGGITGGRVIPRGRLRERPGAAARADFVVVVGADRDAARAEAWELGVSAFSSASRALDVGALGATGAPGALGATGATGAMGAQGAKGAKGAPGAPRGVVAVAGIAHPEQFFRMLRDAGVALVGTMAFADHHRYSSSDINRIQAEVNASGAQVVVTTEKDAVRLDALDTLPFAVTTVPMRLEIDDWAALTAALTHTLSERRRAS
jgi:tetraacyldisaccharide 4'-kinase